MTNMGRILIADDEETFLYSTADLLRREGYECDCASAAQTATQMLRSDSYDLLIADIMMPGNSQLEFVQDVSRVVEGMPVILVTGYPSLDSAVRAIQLPVAAYLIKPVDIADLLVRVRASIVGFRVYQAVCSTRQRLLGLYEGLTSFEESLSSDPGCVSPLSIDAFTELVFANISDALSDLRLLMGSFVTPKDERGSCHPLDHLGLIALMDVLAATIDVLRKTKTALRFNVPGTSRGRAIERGNRGMRLSREGKYLEAIAEMCEALEIDPENDEIRKRLTRATNLYATDLLSGDMIDEAIGQLTDLKKRGLADGYTYYKLAATHYIRGLYDEAIIEAEEAIRLEPNNIDYYSLLAQIYLSKCKLKSDVWHGARENHF